MRASEQLALKETTANDILPSHSLAGFLDLVRLQQQNQGRQS